ncbi:MAG: phosphonate C-P lyase system protein PhnH [Pseudomonadota bacterium]
MNALPAPPLDLAEITPGFGDPTRDSQSVFRRVMEAVARPGAIQDLSFAPEPPAGLGRAAAAVALTLFDFETPVWLDPALRGAAADWLRFHCACPIVDDPGRAAFAIVADVADAPPLSAFHQGDAKYPDRSTTVIIQTAALVGGRCATLEGPGIKGRSAIAPPGLNGVFWEQVQANHAQFQFGVDLIFAAGDLITALPRSTRVTIKGD